MRALVTGAAGFIGSHLCEELLDAGHEVLGVDSFTDYYDPAAKARNAARLLARPGFRMRREDLCHTDLHTLVGGRDVVYHLAAQPGVRTSWDTGFDAYTSLNIQATQRLLEAAVRAGTRRFVYASSSSVYGNAARYPCREGDPVQPYSPYGMTKLAGEHLVTMYALNHGLSSVSLRYFTVYGPRQRPEMAMARMIEAGLTGGTFGLFAAGGTVRDFTYVGDVARATLLAGTTAGLEPGLVLNVAGGSPCSMETVLGTLDTILGTPIRCVRGRTVAGDVLRTGGDASRAADLLGWRPRTGLADGLRAQVQARRAELGDLVPARVR